MESRFTVLSALTVIFQIICAITLVVGLAMVIDGYNGAFDQSSSISQFGSNPFLQSPGGPLAQIPAFLKLAGGAILAFYGLTGLVFSGGINVLISLNHNMQTVVQELPAAISVMRKNLAENQSSSSVSALQSSLTSNKSSVTSNNMTASGAIQVEPTWCADCGSPNPASARFCEKCGKSLRRG